MPLPKGPEEAEGTAKHKAGPQPRQAQPGASAPYAAGALRGEATGRLGWGCWGPG